MRAWVPNLVTASRGLAGLVAASWVVDGHNMAAFALFLAAIWTDLVDGPIARALHAENALGEALDPLADKLLLNSLWVALWWCGWAPSWMVGGLLFRDACVVTGHAVGLARGTRWRANRLGRIAVSFEGVAVTVLLFHGPWLGIDWPAVGTALGAITLFLSVASALEYAREGMQAPKELAPSWPLGPRSTPTSSRPSASR